MREYRDIFDLAFDTDPASVTGQAGVVKISTGSFFGDKTVLSEIIPPPTE